MLLIRLGVRIVTVMLYKLCQSVSFTCYKQSWKLCHVHTETGKPLRSETHFRAIAYNKKSMSAWTYAEYGHSRSNLSHSHITTPVFKQQTQHWSCPSLKKEKIKFHLNSEVVSVVQCMSENVLLARRFYYPNSSEECLMDFMLYILQFVHIPFDLTLVFQLFYHECMESNFLISTQRPSNVFMWSCP